MRNSIKRHYMNEALASLTGAATALGVSRIGGERIGEDQELMSTFRHQRGSIWCIGPLAIVAWMTERNALRGSGPRLDFENCQTFFLSQNCNAGTEVSNCNRTFVGSAGFRQQCGNDEE